MNEITSRNNFSPPPCRQRLEGDERHACVRAGARGRLTTQRLRDIIATIYFDKFTFRFLVNGQFHFHYGNPEDLRPERD